MTHGTGRTGTPGAVNLNRAYPETGGGTDSGDLRASEAAACASRGSEVQHLAARVAVCADRVQGELNRLAGLELQSWQSPAGRAYRTAVSLHAASLRRSGAGLQDAVAPVLRHAGNVALSSAKPGY